MRLVAPLSCVVAHRNCPDEWCGKMSSVFDECVQINENEKEEDADGGSLDTFLLLRFNQDGDEDSKKRTRSQIKKRVGNAIQLY